MPKALMDHCGCNSNAHSCATKHVQIHGASAHLCGHLLGIDESAAHSIALEAHFPLFAPQDLPANSRASVMMRNHLKTMLLSPWNNPVFEGSNT